MLRLCHSSWVDQCKGSYQWPHLPVGKCMAMLTAAPVVDDTVYMITLKMRADREVELMILLFQENCFSACQTKGSAHFSKNEWHPLETERIKVLYVLTVNQNNLHPLFYSIPRLVPKALFTWHRCHGKCKNEAALWLPICTSTAFAFPKNGAAVSIGNRFETACIAVSM